MGWGGGAYLFFENRLLQVTVSLFLPVLVQF